MRIWKQNNFRIHNTGQTPRGTIRPRWPRVVLESYKIVSLWHHLMVPSLKGKGQQMNIWLYSLLKWFLNFLAAQWKMKIFIKFLLALLKTITNPKDCSESCIKISFPAFFRCHWLIFSSVHVIAGFLNNIQNRGLRQPKVVTTISAHQKGTLLLWFSGPSIKYSSRDIIPLISKINFKWAKALATRED